MFIVFFENRFVTVSIYLINNLSKFIKINIIFILYLLRYILRTRQISNK